MILFAFLNYFFIFSHAGIILFTLVGWLFQKTRRLHLGLICLILFSWAILGIWFGWGYCFWTDWHWKVQRELGIQNIPHSYVKFLVDSITGMTWDAGLVDRCTEISFYFVTAMSVYVNFLGGENRIYKSRR